MIDPMVQQDPALQAPQPQAPLPDADMGMGMADPGMSNPEAQPQEPTEPPEPGEPEPQDPLTAAIKAVQAISGQDAIRTVYQLAASAAKAKLRLKDLSSQLNARQYQDHLSAHPEARHADVIIAARRRLDALAGERRRLNLAAQTARQSPTPNPGRASIYELQTVAATAAMEHTASGLLLYLSIPPSMLPTGGTSFGQ